MIHLAVLGSTRGTDLQAIIDAVATGTLSASIAIVISNKEDAYILERAKNHNLNSLYLGQNGWSRVEYDKNLSEALKQYTPDLILLIGWMKILSREFVHEWRGKIWNVHPSLLPKHAGGMDLNVHQAVLDVHETVTGCTIHEVDEGVDSGKIILQKKCIVEPNDTADTLKAKVQKLEGEAFIEALQRFSSQYGE